MLDESPLDASSDIHRAFFVLSAKPKLIFLVAEDWYFCSHRLSLANAVQEAEYDVSVVTRVDHYRPFDQHKMQINYQKLRDEAVK